MPAAKKRLPKTGDVILCENNHPLYRFMVDINLDDRVLPEQLERLDERLPEHPTSGENIPDCPECGARWYLRTTRYDGADAISMVNGHASR